MTTTRTPERCSACLTPLPEIDSDRCEDCAGVFARIREISIAVAASYREAKRVIGDARISRGTHMCAAYVARVVECRRAIKRLRAMHHEMVETIRFRETWNAEEPFHDDEDVFAPLRDVAVAS